MAYEFKWYRCNVLYIDDQLEHMGIEEKMWWESYINIQTIVGFSRWEDNGEHGTQLMLQGSPGVVIDTPFEKFREILTE